jgi:hypothetical protein
MNLVILVCAGVLLFVGFLVMTLLLYYLLKRMIIGAGGRV